MFAELPPFSLRAWETASVAICCASALFARWPAVGAQCFGVLFVVLTLSLLAWETDSVATCYAAPLFASLATDSIVICCASALFANLESRVCRCLLSFRRSLCGELRKQLLLPLAVLPLSLLASQPLERNVLVCCLLC